MEKFLVELSKQIPDEIAGVKTYKELAERTDNPSEKQKLLEIANQEYSHYETIKNILESYM